MITTTTFTKTIGDVAHLQSYLRDGGITDAVAVYQPGTTPNLYVHHDDAQDPTTLVNAYTIPDYFVAVSNKPLVNGVPEADADGADVHSVTVTKYDGVTKTAKGSGSEQLKIMSTTPITVSPNPATLSNGAVVVSFGPVSMIGDWDLRIEDDAGNILPVFIKLRFV